MRRRNLLTRVSYGAPLLITGCLDSADGSDPEQADTEPDDDPSQTTERREDSIFVENRTETQATVDVAVAQADTGQTVVDATYDVPGRVGLEIPNVGTEERTYTVTAETDTASESFEWRVLSCDRDGVDTGEATELGIGITDDGLRIGNDDCDETGVGDRTELTYEDHEAYRRSEEP